MGASSPTRSRENQKLAPMGRSYAPNRNLRESAKASNVAS